jgi:AraC-like DNA-binding protein
MQARVLQSTLYRLSIRECGWMASLRLTALNRVPLILLAWADNHGVDSHEAARAAGIDRSGLSDPDCRVPVNQIWALWQILIDESRDADLGLHIGSTPHVRDFGLAGYAVYYSKSLREALVRVTRYSRIVNEIVVFDLVEGPDHARFVSDNVPRFDAVRQPIDSRLASILMMAREIAGEDIDPVEVDFPYVRPANVAEHRRLFRTKLEFDRPAATMVFRREDLDRPVESGDGTLGHYLDQLADEVLVALSKGSTFADRVRSAIWTDLSTGKTSVQRIAKRLGVSPRSLQRHLTEEGTTFSVELDALREEMARTLLRDRRHAVCEVAFLLGYSEPSSFFRAFRRWERMSPVEYRRTAGHR